MMNYEHWLADLKRSLEEKTGRRDVEVTGGPYRSYDVRVSHKDCHPLVDFYSAMRWDSRRVEAALDYAVAMVKDWEATLAAREKEMRVVRPHFERLQSMFSGLELHYTVQYGETHFIRAEREQGRIMVNFDLWPAMKGKDIQRLSDYIKEYAEKLSEPSETTMAGADYW